MGRIESGSTIDRYAVLLVEAAQADPGDGAAACASLATRFPDVAAPQVCP